MPAERLSPTALKIDLEETVARTLKSSANGPKRPVLVQLLSQMDLPELYERRSQLQLAQRQDGPTESPRDPLVKDEEDLLEVALRIRRARVRKWIAYKEEEKPASMRQYIDGEKRLIGGADPLLLDAWRMFPQSFKRGSAGREAAMTLLRRHSDHSLSQDFSQGQSQDNLGIFVKQVTNSVAKELRSIAQPRQQLDQIQHYAIAFDPR